MADQWTGYMDGYLKKNLDIAKEVIKKDWDMVFIVDGYEGTGKSVLAQQCAKYCDETLTLDRIVFTPKEFKKVINKAEKYQAVVYDEAYGGMSSRAALSAINRSLMSVLSKIRQKNLFVFIVLPCFFELDKYAAVWRGRGLIHVYTDKGFERGRFSFYNQDRKKALYVLGKKYFSYNKPAPNFFGRFVKGYAVDKDAYRNKKDSVAVYDDEEKKPRRLENKEIQLSRAIRLVRKYNPGITQAKLELELGVSKKFIKKAIDGGVSRFRDGVGSIIN